MQANKTGTITNGCAFKPQIRNMIANEETRSKTKVSNLIDVIVRAPNRNERAWMTEVANPSFTICDTGCSMSDRGGDIVGLEPRRAGNRPPNLDHH
jgi:hypothetical protein